MFKKLLNVGKGHSNSEKLQQQQQQKNLFQLNEIRSYGFSHLCCLGYSPSLSLLAVGSKFGLLRVLGNSSVEFSYQLESGNAIRQIEFIDCRRPEQQQQQPHHNTGKKSPRESAPEVEQSATKQQQQQLEENNPSSASAKIVVLTDNGQLHLLELKTCKQLNFADNTTQTDGNTTSDCCQQQQQQQQPNDTPSSSEYTKLEFVACLDYFRHKPDIEDRSKRVTTFEISADYQSVFVGTEGGNVYQVPLAKFHSDHQQVQQQQQADQAPAAITTITTSATTTTGVVTGKRSATPSRADDNTNEVAASLAPAAAAADGKEDDKSKKDESLVAEDETTAVNLNDEPQINVDDDDVLQDDEPFEMIKFAEHILPNLGDHIKSKKQGAVESIKRHPSSASAAAAASNGKLLLISYHRGLNVIYDVEEKSVIKYFYHNQVLESSCFADQAGDFFYTSHNDGSYIKWDTRLGSQAKANEDFLGQLYGPYPCKPTAKIQACTGLVNDQLEDLIVFSGGMPRATYDDKNPVTIVKADPDGKDSIKTVLDFTSKVLDFVVITRPRGNLGVGAKSTGGSGGGGANAGGGGGGGGKKNKLKQQQQQQQKQEQQRNQPIAVALAILAEEEFVVIDLLNSELYLEFALPYLNCVHSSAITCNQHYSDISDQLYGQLLAYNRQQLKGKLSTNEWPITGGKVIDAPELKTRDILLTGHEDGSVNFWDVSDLSMRHLLHLTTARLFSTNDDLDFVDPASAAAAAANKETVGDDENAPANNSTSDGQDGSAWPPMKRVGRFDPYSDDTRLAIRKLSMCPRTGTLVVAGTGGQVLVFELKDEPSELESLVADEVTIVSDQRFTWKGREKLGLRSGSHKFPAGYQVSSFVQLQPPVAPTSLDVRADWSLYALGTSYGFYLYDYATKRSVVTKCTLNVQDFAMVSGDASGAGAMSRKKSFRKSLRESFRRLRRGRSQRQPQPTTGTTTAAAASNASSAAAAGPTAAAADQAQQQAAVKPAAFSRATTGVRSLNPPSIGAGRPVQDASAVAAAAAAMYSNERQVEQKVELSSIVKCITLTSAIISSTMSFKPTLWVGTNSGQVLVYAIELASEQPQSKSSNETSAASEPTAAAAAADVASGGEQQPILTTARLAKEIQLKHRAPIIAIFTSPEAPPVQQTPLAEQEETSESAKSTPEKQPSELALLKQSSSDSSATTTTKNETTNGSDEQRPQTPAGQQQVEAASSPGSKSSSPSKKQLSSMEPPVQQPRVLICSEEQFKVFNLPNLKPFCKFKLTAHEGLRAKKISITQFLKPASNMMKTNSATSGQHQQQQQQQAQVTSSKSLQSFAATQTSPPSSPMPPSSGAEAAADGSQANGSSKQLASSESNNNSLSALNNNHNTNGKELMNAKFGAKSSETKHEQQQSSLEQQQQQQQQHSDGASGSQFEPYMVCMSNQGDCAIYSVPDLKRQAQIQVCKREDVNGITSTMLTNFGEGYYLKSSSNFLRFSISSQRVPRILSVV